MYRNIESTLMHFLEYVPIRDNLKVYSPKLLPLILQIGGYVDTEFKEMAFFADFKENPKCEEIRKKARKNKVVSIDLFREVFEPIYNLSSQNVFVRLEAGLQLEKFTPFLGFNKESPKWWKAYNKLKHSWHANVKKANLENALNALGSAFVLKAVHIPSKWMLARYRVIIADGKPIQQVLGNELLKKVMNQNRNVGMNVYAETPLFVYFYQTRPSYRLPSQTLTK